MRAPVSSIGSCARLAAVATAGLVVAWLWLPGSVAFGQDAAPPPQAAPAQPAPQETPGLFESIGRWLDEGASSFRDHLRGAKQRIDTFGDRAAEDRKEFDKKASEAGKTAVEITRDAVEAVAKIPTTRVTTGRERCVVAPNGAPDCIAAANALCRKHGFSSGKSMDFTSAEECPARTLLAGRQSGPECTTVTFISRAMCQ